MGNGDALGATVCEYAGHEWADTGGGVQICGVCRAERWDPERYAVDRRLEDHDEMYGDHRVIGH